MTRREGSIVIIEAEPPDRCELCGKTAETRPYGPGGKRVCFQCANATPEATEEAKRRFGALLDGKEDLP